MLQAKPHVRPIQMRAPQMSFNVILATVVMLIVILITSSWPGLNALHLSSGRKFPEARHSRSNQFVQLNPPSSLIRPIECRNANNHSEAGICMFSIDCMHNKGTPLSICKHNYFVGTCCKLPDHNNFVGIVYDLRENEALAHLGARLDLALSTSPGGVAVSVGQKESLGTPLVFSSTNGQQIGAQNRPVNKSIINAPVPSTRIMHDSDESGPTTRTLPSSAEHEPQSTSTTGTTLSPSSSTVLRAVVTQTTPQDDLVASEKLLVEEKYMISSTSLFAGQTATTTTNKIADSPLANAVESARNTDSSTAAQISVSSNSAGSERPSQADNKTTYELIRDELSAVMPLTSKLPNEQPPAVLSSAHSPLSTTASTSTTTTPGPELQTTQTVSDEQRVTILFANNHGPSSLSSGQATTDRGQPEWSVAPSSSSSSYSYYSSSPSATSQEFLLSSIPASNTATPSSLATDTITSTESLPQASSELATATNQSQPIDSSPFYDLISSLPVLNSSTLPSQASQTVVVQTTTPFTSSLSTALLPNVSPHAFPTSTTENNNISTTTPMSLSSLSSPGTEQATSQTILLSQHQQQQQTSTTNSNSRPASTGKPVVLFASTEPVKLTQNAQLYSNQHASKPSSLLFAAMSPSGSAAAAPLQAASKIVAGSSVPSNNLIPGLSGLQSAILSHIPFKIASGLSSGLSSYLQAAMRPTAPGPNNRPLISSNTAPALSYQSSSPSSSRPSSTVAPSTSSTSGHASQLLAASTTTTGNVSLVSHAPNVIMPNQQRDTLREAQLVCGRPQVAPIVGETNKKRVARIVGGNQSLFGQWPWMVSLRQWRKGAFLHKCGAALLNENWAITAAHCVENVKAPDLLLRLGEFDVSNQNEPFPYIERRVKTVVSHSSFDPKTFEYDLALLKFAEPIQYERNIIPVCVPNGNDSYVDRIATVIGWGRLYEDGPLPDIIQHVDVPIIANDECEKMYKNAGYVEEIPEMFICAGINKGGRDSCEGDSGGPLTMIDYDGRSYLVGIISWGIGCALPSQPGVYTRITAFSDWINQIIVT